MGLFSGPIFGNGGVFGGSPTTPDPQGDARLAMAAQLLQGGGYSPQRSTFGQIMAQALMAGQAARQQSIQMNQARDAAELDKRYKEAQIQNMGQGQDPGSVKEYEFAKANGYTGTYQEWVNMKGQTSRPSSVQEWEFFNGLNPKDQARYLEMKRNPNWKVADVNSVPNVIQGGPGGTVQTTPLSTLPATAAAASTVEQAKNAGGALGTAEGNIQGGIQTKGSNAETVLNMTKEARKLLKDSTGSLGGSVVDSVAGSVGISTKGAQAGAQLKVLQAGMMLNMPRMEGPQSDADRMLYQQAAAQVGDTTVPVETRAAALDTIDNLQKKYQERAQGASQSPGKKLVYDPATGTFK